MAKTRKTETAGGATAYESVQKEIKKTGEEPGDPVGDTPSEKKTPVKTSTVGESSDSSVPKDVNKDVWEQAAHVAEDKGGLSGVDKKGRNALIRVQYDQMIENDRATKDWAGVNKDTKAENTVLGDVK